MVIANQGGATIGSGFAMLGTRLKSVTPGSARHRKLGGPHVRLRTALLLPYTAALIACLSLTSPLVSGAADARSATVDAAKIRIDNFGQVNPNYYRGAQPKSGDYADLARLGVKTVINLTSDDA